MYVDYIFIQKYAHSCLAAKLNANVPRFTFYDTIWTNYNFYQALTWLSYVTYDNPSATYFRFLE